MTEAGIDREFELYEFYFFGIHEFLPILKCH